MAVLTKDATRHALARPIDLISNIKVGDEASRAKDVLGRVYDYFLSQFAGAEGKRGRRVLHAAPRGQASGRDARALPRPRA